MKKTNYYFIIRLFMLVSLIASFASAEEKECNWKNQTLPDGSIVKVCDPKPRSPKPVPKDEKLNDSYKVPLPEGSLFGK